MDDNVSVVDQYPRAITFTGERPFLMTLLERIDDRISDGVRLPLAIGGHDNQEVGVGRLPADFDDGEVLTLDVLRRFGDGQGLVSGFDSCFPQDLP